MIPSVDRQVQFTVPRIANPSYKHSIRGKSRPAGHARWETRQAADSDMTWASNSWRGSWTKSAPLGHLAPATACNGWLSSASTQVILQSVLMGRDTPRDRRPDTPWQPPIQRFARLNRNRCFEVIVECVEVRRCVFVITEIPAMACLTA
jgi:hypothetical protein